MILSFIGLLTGGGSEIISSSDARDREARILRSIYRGYRTSARGVAWRLVLPGGALVGVAPFILSVFLIQVYATTEWLTGEYLFGLFGDADGGVEAFGSFLGRFGAPLLYLVSVVAAALFIGRRVGPAAVVNGVALGVVALVVSNVATLQFGAPRPFEVVIYPFILIGGGILGGLRGWGIRAGERAMSRANRAVSVARSAEEVIEAVGENLAGTNVSGISLWRPGGSGDFERVSSWSPRPDRGSLPGPGSDPAAAGSLLSGPVRLRSREVSGEERAAWERRGIKSALLVPLTPPGGGPGALLAIASGREYGISRRDARAYTSVAATVSLALENLRLVEEARRTGMRAGVLEERQRMAHEIHDTLAQGFTSIVTNLEAAEGAMEPESAGVRWHLKQARSIARESLTEARRLVWRLGPGELENAPLPEALGGVVRKWSDSAGVEAESVVTGEPQQLPAEVESTVLRVSQEALANVGKHAGAARAAVTLSYMPDALVVDVRDDGDGFDLALCAASPSGDGSGFGLRGMRERVEKLGGTLAVESEPGEGTNVSVELPVRAEAKARS